jgi:hypothetical protein
MERDWVFCYSVSLLSLVFPSMCDIHDIRLMSEFNWGGDWLLVRSPCLSRQVPYSGDSSLILRVNFALFSCQVIGLLVFILDLSNPFESKAVYTSMHVLLAPLCVWSAVPFFISLFELLGLDRAKAEFETSIGIGRPRPDVKSTGGGWYSFFSLLFLEWIDLLDWVLSRCLGPIN